ncbi:MAG: chemotaxis protein CheD [candidate division Zixibacteria bacterium]|nr:chemotaxis protein CheD [candidate division Zixibacteria bacterium]
MEFLSNLKIIDVDTGEIQVSSEPIILQSIALGSCVALVVYDRNLKIGGIAHIMLPGKSLSAKNTKFSADAIESLLESINKLGAKTSDLEISIVGGANVLREGDIPNKVIESVLYYLKKSNLELNNMRVGGVERRSVFLDIESGNVFYTEGNSTKKILLKEIENI